MDVGGLLNAPATLLQGKGSIDRGLKHAKDPVVTIRTENH
jgi:hypothetical protein